MPSAALSAYSCSLKTTKPAPKAQPAASHSSPAVLPPSRTASTARATHQLAVSSSAVLMAPALTFSRCCEALNSSRCATRAKAKAPNSTQKVSASSKTTYQTN